MLGLRLAPRLCLALRCVVCDRLKITGDDNDDEAQVALFGAKAYAQCPCCRKVTHAALFHDPDYRRRVRVWLFENQGVVLRTP